MKFEPFSPKQLAVLHWWLPKSSYSSFDAIICDGAVRSGKTLCMSVSFIAWAMFSFRQAGLALCGRSVASLRRNVIAPLLPILREIGFDVHEKVSQNLFEVRAGTVTNTFYLFGGYNETSSSLIQGITLSGILFDEVALMPRSFVEQAMARCSVSRSKLWFNCNPESPQHWFFREWVSRAKEKKAYYLHFTMDDNPALSPSIRERYQNLYSGVFYDRFILGKWVVADGLIYPFMTQPHMLFDVPPEKELEQFAVSCDYGTVNPASFGLWALYRGVWYRIDEYYYDSRRHHLSRTDEEHYTALCDLIGGRQVSAIVVDPSAASFIQVIKNHGDYPVLPAQNDVLDGIRQTSSALKRQTIRICRTCSDCIREFALYRWKPDGKDAPVKENDHAMDDVRYFVTSVLLRDEDDFFAFASDRL